MQNNKINNIVYLCLEYVNCIDVTKSSISYDNINKYVTII